MADDTTTPPDTTAATPAPDSLPEVTVSAQQPPELSDYASALSDIDPKAGRVEQIIEAEQKPALAASDAAAQQHFKLSQQWREREAALSQQMADWTQKVGSDMASYVEKTPTRQGIYAANLHMAPLLSILSAVGGKMTRASGLQMLAAQNGIVQGLNQGNEEAYQAARQQWKDGFDKYTAQVKMQEQYYNLMLKAYGGRADAEEKAALAAERMSGNIRAEGQKKLSTAAGLIKTESQAANQPAHLKLAEEGLELRRKELAIKQQRANQAAEKKAQATGREAIYTQRMITSGNQALKDTANIMEMPIAVHSALLGTGHYANIFETPKSALANKMTTQEVQLYGVATTGIQRSLANIEANGLAPQGSLTGQMESVIIRPGDTYDTKLMRMAEIRQIVEGGLEPILANPRVSDEQKQFVTQIMDRMKKVVPYTVHDVISLATTDNPNATIRDIAGKQGLIDRGGRADTPSSTAREPMKNPGYATRDEQGRVLQHSKSQGYVYVNPNDPSDWVAAPASPGRQ